MCVCVFVYLVFSTLLGTNVPTRIVIPVHFDLAGTFFMSSRGNNYRNHTELSFLKI